MRSLTLAQALTEQRCVVRFKGAGVPEAVRRLFHDSIDGIDREDVGGDEADALGVLADHPDFVVVDGYHFAPAFFRTLERAGTPYALIDDNCETTARNPALVLNQNPHATADLYGEMVSRPVLLLGLQYSLIRREILATKRMDLQRTPGSVLVAMGGSDPLRLTVPIVESVLEVVACVLVSLGPVHAARDDISSDLIRFGERAVLIDQEDFVTTLATCEFAVLSAGSSLWEAACLGIPTIAVVVAENQRHGAQDAAQSGLAAAVHSRFDGRPDQLGTRVAESLRRLRGSAVCPSGLVDGVGSKRVAETIRLLLAREA
jgi:UDP-2,4-diacetamido-2,4,6-trideoxy-beta-L-altropyranose hydrolase